MFRLSQSLESSLVEKGEIASRLNSTQDEVQQMRTGIEKLRIRIESDERKKKKMGELLKGIILGVVFFFLFEFGLNVTDLSL